MIASYSPKMNGKAKGKKITLTELVVVIILNSGNVSQWWGNILLTIFYVVNRVFKSKNKISLYEILKKKTTKLVLF